MRLNNRVIALGGGLALAVGLLTIPTAAQDFKARTKAAPPVRAGEPVRGTEPVRGGESNKVAHAPGVHVPDFFNKIEPALSNEQRERIYEIQARALRESEAVLTPAQRSSLQEHRGRSGSPAVREEMPPTREPVRDPSRIPARKKAG